VAAVAWFLARAFPRPIGSGANRSGLFRKAFQMATNRANEYRRLARECLTIARTVSTQETRVALIDMARVWTRLADEQDAAVPPNTAVENAR
jgi:hypothetical protein